jgi:hypothetical protein
MKNIRALNQLRAVGLVRLIGFSALKMKLYVEQKMKQNKHQNRH